MKTGAGPGASLYLKYNKFKYQLFEMAEKLSLPVNKFKL